jgi:hypothetical protein
LLVCRRGELARVHGDRGSVCTNAADSILRDRLEVTGAS